MSVGVADEIKETLKRAAGALRDGDVPFVLGGGLAVWARGGPESGHDVDFMIRKLDVERALDALEHAGMRTERPPEGWLVKAYDGDVLVDLIFEPSGMPITDEVLQRADKLVVMAVPMHVLSAEDVLVTKLLALREHALFYGGCLEVARALREQIDFEAVRRRTEASPFARAFFTLIEGLGIISPGPAQLRSVPDPPPGERSAPAP